MAELIVCGVIEYVFRMEKNKQNHNLVFVRNILKLTFEKFEGMFVCGLLSKVIKLTKCSWVGIRNGFYPSSFFLS